MSSIQTVLKEELERLKKLRERYLKEIGSLPSGSLSIKIRKERKYAYRAYRDGIKVRTEYIGPVDSDRTLEIKQLIIKRKEMEKLLRKTVSRIAEIQKAVKYG